MTASLPPNITLYWNDSLAEELLSFLTGRIKCSETAADLTQETFLRFHQFIQTTPPDNARALAYRIAINLANDYQRKVKVRQTYNANTDLTDIEDIHPSEIPGPEQIVMAQQQLQCLQDALNELSEECRTVFLLHSVQGLTYFEIAAKLGISRSMVGRHLVMALAHSKQRLKASE
ncbi:RNA polymerase sigma factor [Methylomonas sp. AM2-LC]|uniref:RNA polymerase sigma factor n=1 Tax=Methylomonas sp. AM2-LC TaxID=3153301 RepID=UPI0032634732